MIKKLFFWSLVLCTLFSVNELNAQKLHTSSKKAIKLFDEAELSLKMNDIPKAIEMLDKAVKADEKFLEAWLYLIDIYDRLDSASMVIYACEKALKSAEDGPANVYFFYANALFHQSRYAEAYENAKKFLDKKMYSSNQKYYMEKVLRNSLFAMDAIKHPVPFSPNNIGINVNTKYDEYWPSLSADEEILIYTRLMPKNANNPKPERNRQEDLFYSMRISGQWTTSRPLTLNTPDNEGAETITSDGRLMYFTACNRRDGKGMCDIYVTEKVGDIWTEPRNLGEPVNTSASEKQPSVSADGRTLYFASNRNGTKGDLDIWYSVQNAEGKWSIPVNLGDSINTPDVEQSPFIHADMQTLYFSSNGWPGMGGADIFLSRKKTGNQWVTPLNLGYPINTGADELGLIINSGGDRAYFASNRNIENGRDIYEFELYPEARPIVVSYFKGHVADADTRKPLNATFELIDLKTSNVVNKSFSDRQTGEFLVCLPTNRDYALNVSKKGYLFYSENFSLSAANNKMQPLLKDVFLQPVKAGNRVILKNIFFETNSYELKKESTVELNKLVQFLNDNPDIKIEIGGHTDNIGSDVLNQTLSENRAKSVAEYLVSKGIMNTRLTFKGYGKTQPVADNTSDDGRAQNRRTEFKIIAN